MLPELYRPAPEEIDPLIARAIAKHPHAQPYLERAARILHLGRIVAYYPHDYTLCVLGARSERDPQIIYQLGRTGDRDTCDCRNFHDKPVLIGSRPFCKHTLALATYRRILDDHLAELLRRGLVALEDDHPFDPLAAWPGMAVRVLQTAAGRYTLANHKQLYRFARLLARRFVLAPEPTAEPAPITA